MCPSSAVNNHQLPLLNARDYADFPRSFTTKHCFISKSTRIPTRIAEINIGFINILGHFDSARMTLKRFIFLTFKAVENYCCLRCLFTYNSYESTLSCSLGCCLGRTPPSKGGSFESQSPLIYGVRTPINL